MKGIKAYIKKHRFDAVMTELSKVEQPGVGGISTYETLGYGKGKAINVDDAITYELHSLIPNICIEIFCNNEMLHKIVEAIKRGAHTGLKGDGKIFTYTIDSAIRVRDERTGEEVI